MAKENSCKGYNINMKGDILFIPKKYYPSFLLKGKQVVAKCSKEGQGTIEVDEISLKPYRWLKYDEKEDGLKMFTWDNTMISRKTARNYQDGLVIRIASHKNDPRLPKWKNLILADGIGTLWEELPSYKSFPKENNLYILNRPNEGVKRYDNASYYFLDEKEFSDIYGDNRITFSYGRKPFINSLRIDMGTTSGMNGYIFDYIGIYVGGHSSYMPPENWITLLHELKDIKITTEKIEE